MFDYERPIKSITKIIRTTCKDIGKIPSNTHHFHSRTDYKNRHYRANFNSYYFNKTFIKRIYSYRDVTRGIHEEFGYFNIKNNEVALAMYSPSWTDDYSAINGGELKLIFKTEKDSELPIQIKVDVTRAWALKFENCDVDIHQLKSKDVKYYDVVFGYFKEEVVEGWLDEFEPTTCDINVHEYNSSSIGLVLHNTFGYTSIDGNKKITNPSYYIDHEWKTKETWEKLTSKERKLRKLSLM